MRKLRLLIADDDREVRDWLRLALRPLNATMAEASDGAALLELLLGAEGFDLVVTDIRMPRCSGLEAALEARRAGRLTPLIFITGFGDEETAAAVQALGRSVLLAKPVDAADLLQHIGRLLGDDDHGGIDRC